MHDLALRGLFSSENIQDSPCLPLKKERKCPEEKGTSKINVDK